MRQALLAFLLPLALAIVAGDVQAQGEVVLLWGAENVVAPTTDNFDFVAIAPSGFRFMSFPLQWVDYGIKADGRLMFWLEDGIPVQVADAPTDIVAVSAWGLVALRRGGSIWTRGTYPPGPNEGFTAVSGSPVHCLALRADGSIVAWGDNTYGQCNVPEPNSGYTAIAAGGTGNPIAPQPYGFSVAVRNGSVVAWGANSFGQCEAPEPNTGFIDVSASDTHCMGLKNDGSVVAWGWCLSNCTPPEPNAGFVAVAAGGMWGDYPYSLALGSDGAVQLLGNSIPPNSGLVAIAAAAGHAIAIRGEPLDAIQLAPPAPPVVSAAPNPFSFRTVITAPATSRNLVVYDSTGRLVRTLGQTMEWDGIDAHGRSVPAGVYFLRLDSPHGPRSLRVVLLQ